MPESYVKCQYIDSNSTLECENWYASDEDEQFCPNHRPKKEVNHIPRTVTVMSDDHLNKLNEKVSQCLQMSIPELVSHIKEIEDRIKDLERDRRAANIAKRNLEDKLSDEERAALREDTTKYRPSGATEPKVKKSPEEKAKSRKQGFSAWAARLGVKVDDLMVMDDDEMTARIAKYKASKG